MEGNTDKQEAIKAWKSLFDSQEEWDGHKICRFTTGEIAARMYAGIDTKKARRILNTLLPDTMWSHRFSNYIIWELKEVPGWKPGRFKGYMQREEDIDAGI